MKDYNKIKQLRPEQFKRLIGVKRDTFEAMLEVCKLYHKRKKAKGGKPNKLSVNTQLLLMLEYYKEYRCMANMGLVSQQCIGLFKRWRGIVTIG